MAEPYFIWNGKDSREMGVIVTGIPPVVYPAERVEEKKILGRSGSLLLTEGEGVFDGYYKAVTIANRRALEHREIAAWLRGAGKLVLSSEPNYCYDARVIKEAQATRVFKNVYEGSVAFFVQPLKEEYPPEPVVPITASGDGSTTITARGDVPARPVYRIEGTGEIVLTVGDATEDGTGSVLSIDLDTGMDGFVVDTDAAMVTSLDGTENLCSLCELFYNGFRGLWLPVGETTTISWTGSVTSVSIDPRWRWL